MPVQQQQQDVLLRLVPHPIHWCVGTSLRHKLSTNGARKLLFGGTCAPDDWEAKFKEEDDDVEEEVTVVDVDGSSNDGSPEEEGEITSRCISTN